MTHVSHALWAMAQGMDNSHKSKTRGKRSDAYRAKKARYRAKKKLESQLQMSAFELWCKDKGYVGENYLGSRTLMPIFFAEIGEEIAQ